MGHNSFVLQDDPILMGALKEMEESPTSYDGTPRFQEEIEFLWETAKVLSEFGVPPARIYAMIKTERILTEANAKYLSHEDIQEWEMFCLEYETMVIRD